MATDGSDAPNIKAVITRLNADAGVLSAAGYDDESFKLRDLALKVERGERKRAIEAKRAEGAPVRGAKPKA